MSRPSTPSAAKPLFTTVRKVVVVVAMVLILTAAVLSLVGMGSDVGVLSGTQPSTVGGAAAGLAYAAMFFGAVLLAPVLLLFVLFAVLLDWMSRPGGWTRSPRR